MSVAPTYPSMTASPAEAPPASCQVPVHTDALGFDSFFREYYPLALNYLYRRLRDRELAEEIVAAAFARLVPAATRAGITDYTPWVYSVVLNELRRYLRSQRARGQLHERFEELQRAQLSSQTPPGEGLDFESVSAAVWRLKEKYASVLTLRYFERLTAGEIAKIVKASESTVRTRLCRGLILLREQLGIRPS
jgi:RNA polymerase sigma factor (sigma-70 family)